MCDIELNFVLVVGPSEADIVSMENEDGSRTIEYVPGEPGKLI